MYDLRSNLLIYYISILFYAAVSCRSDMAFALPALLRRLYSADSGAAAMRRGFFRYMPFCGAENIIK